MPDLPRVGWRLTRWLVYKRTAAVRTRAVSEVRWIARKIGRERHCRIRCGLVIKSGSHRLGSALRIEEGPCEKRTKRAAQSDPYNNDNKYGLHFAVSYRAS